MSISTCETYRRVLPSSIIDLPYRDHRDTYAFTSQKVKENRALVGGSDPFKSNVSKSLSPGIME